CFRKENYLNVGFGRVDHPSVPRSSAEFLEFLRARYGIPPGAEGRWNGHAYLLSEPVARRVVDSGLLLIGDSAGLAYPESGEGIRPAIESGPLAADVLIAAKGRYSSERLASYARHVRQRFGHSRARAALGRAIPPSLTASIGRQLMNVPWFVRH